jgi:hypothetical protein
MLSMLKMVKKKVVQRNHVLFIYHLVDGLLDNIKPEVSKRRIDVESPLTSFLVVHAHEAPATAGVSVS